MGDKTAPRREQECCKQTVPDMGGSAELYEPDTGLELRRQPQVGEQFASL